jgi:hypothetical protein
LLVGFFKSKAGCGFAVPVNSVPKSFGVPAHDLEHADRALVPALDLSQDRFDSSVTGSELGQVSTIELNLNAEHTGKIGYGGSDENSVSQ